MTCFGTTLTPVAEKDHLAEWRQEVVIRREDLGLTSGEAATLAGISGQRWRNLERGWEMRQGHKFPAKPRRDTVIKMAAALRWTADDALTMANMRAIGEGERRRTSLSEERDRLWGMGTDAQRRMWLHMMRVTLDPAGEEWEVEYRNTRKLYEERSAPREPASGELGAVEDGQQAQAADE